MSPRPALGQLGGSRLSSSISRPATFRPIPKRVHPIDHAGRFFHCPAAPLNVAPARSQGQLVILHRGRARPAMRGWGACRQAAEVVLAQPATIAEAKRERADWRALASPGTAATSMALPLTSSARWRSWRRQRAAAARRRAAEARRVWEAPGTAGVDAPLSGTPETVSPRTWPNGHAAGACDGFRYPACGCLPVRSWPAGPIAVVPAAAAGAGLVAIGLRLDGRLAWPSRPASAPKAAFAA